MEIFLTIGRDRNDQGKNNVWSDLGTAQHVLLIFPPSFFHLCVKLSIELEKEGQLVWEEMVAMGEAIFLTHPHVSSSYVEQKQACSIVSVSIYNYCGQRCDSVLNMVQLH